MGSQHPSPNVKTVCNFGPNFWPEIITSHDAESTCFKGSRTSCEVMIFGFFWAKFWPEKITSRDGCFLPIIELQCQCLQNKSDSWAFFAVIHTVPNCNHNQILRFLGSCYSFSFPPALSWRSVLPHFKPNPLAIWGHKDLALLLVLVQFVGVAIIDNFTRNREALVCLGLRVWRWCTFEGRGSRCRLLFRCTRVPRIARFGFINGSNHSSFSQKCYAVFKSWYNGDVVVVVVVVVVRLFRDSLELAVLSLISGTCTMVCWYCGVLCFFVHLLIFSVFSVFSCKPNPSFFGSCGLLSGWALGFAVKQTLNKGALGTKFAN